MSRISLACLGCAAVLLLAAFPALAQENGKKTIDIVSDFKPSLLKPDKQRFAPTPYLGDTNRATAPYAIPAQNLSFSFSPASLRPLAYDADSLLQPGDRVFIKAGVGNLKSATIRAVATFGDGKHGNGMLNGFYDGARGKLPFQQYARYGIGVKNSWNLKGNNRFQARAGYDRHDTYRYGFQPETIDFNKADLRLNYNHFTAGGSLSNVAVGSKGLYYQGSIDFHHFSDNKSNSENMLEFDLDARKLIGERGWVSLGLNGMAGSADLNDKSLSNNVVLIPISVGYKVNNRLQIKAGLIPSWNQTDFNLLPDLTFDYLIKDGKFVFQGGFTGSYQRNSFRTLADFNPWIAAPERLVSTQRSELFGALKGVVDEHFSFRVKTGFARLENLPLFLNDQVDGKAFEIVYDRVSNVNIEGELTWQQGEKWYWTNTLKLNSFVNFQRFNKAYGWLPLEFRSNIRFKVMEDLQLQADLFGFSGTWYRQKAGGWEKGAGGFDLSAGLQYQINKRFGAWVDFRNLLNNDYQRWNQYRVVGFQVLGGVSFRM